MAEETEVKETSEKVEKVEVKDRTEPLPLRSIQDIVRDLSKPVSRKHLRTKKLSGKEITFISWSDCVKYLRFYAPGFSYKIASIQHIKDQVVIVAEISVPCLEGVVTVQATGNENDQTSSFGDPFSNSESMALRRAASKLGFGLYLYDK